MKLRKLNERSVRRYDENGMMTETIESAEYGVYDNDGASLGSVTCNEYNASLYLNVNVGSIDAGVQRIAEMLGATIEEGGEA